LNFASSYYKEYNGAIKGSFLMLLCSLCLCLGQLVWKLMSGLDWLYLLSGFALFALGALLMILAYRYGEMSVLQPINSMSYVYSLFLGHIVFQEDITAFRITGVAAIMLGVLFLGLGSSR
jgi:undecaprenyl phosphate-alpha-L-ara4N flippase subunit ArnE